MKKSGLKHINLVAVKSAHGNPDENDLALINSFTLREFKADELYMRTMYLAHNAIDRDGEVIDTALIDNLATTLPGKGFFVKHPASWDGDSGPGEGRFFKAEKITMSQEEARELLREPTLEFVGDEQATLLQASFYMSRAAGGDNLIAKIDAGIAGDVSIGFNYAERTPIKRPDESVMAYRLHSPGQAYEGSLVWLGAQPGARIHKQASTHDNEGGSMELTAKEAKELKDKYDALKAKHAELADKQPELQAAATELKTLKDALGDTSVDALKAQAEVGQQYHKALVDDVVAAERLAGLIEGDDEATVKTAKESYADWPVERLKTYCGKVSKMAGSAGEIQGGDPNTSGAQGGEKGSKDESSPFNNKLIAG